MYEVMQMQSVIIAEKSCDCCCSCSACNCSDRATLAGEAGRQGGYAAGNSGHDYIAGAMVLLS